LTLLDTDMAPAVPPGFAAFFASAVNRATGLVWGGGAPIARRGLARHAASRVNTAFAALLGFGAALGMAGCGSAEEPPLSLETRFPADASEDLALSFDGENDYATMGLGGFPLATAAQTLTARVKPTSAGGTRALLVLRLDFEHGITLGFRDDLPTAWRVSGGNIFVQGPTLNDGEWHHVAYVSTGGDSATHILYIDGSEVDRRMVSPSNRTPTSAWLGSVDGKGEFYRGLLDDVRVWEGARSAENIATEAVDGPAEDAQLLGYWSFDESSGERARDRSGNGNHAVLGDGIADFIPARVPTVN
jgi:hypothetical protein